MILDPDLDPDLEVLPEMIPVPPVLAVEVRTDQAPPAIVVLDGDLELSPVVQVVDPNQVGTSEAMVVEVHPEEAPPPDLELSPAMQVVGLQGAVDSHLEVQQAMVLKVDIEEPQEVVSETDHEAELEEMVRNTDLEVEPPAMDLNTDLEAQPAMVVDIDGGVPTVTVIDTNQPGMAIDAHREAPSAMVFDEADMVQPAMVLDADLEALLGEDLEAFQAMVANMFSFFRRVRSEAESLFARLKSGAPDATVQQLMKCIHVEDARVCSKAADLLKDVILTKWEELTSSTKSEIQSGGYTSQFDDVFSAVTDPMAFRDMLVKMASPDKPILTPQCIVFPNISLLPKVTSKANVLFDKVMLAAPDVIARRLIICLLNTAEDDDVCCKAAFLLHDVIVSGREHLTSSTKAEIKSHLLDILKSHRHDSVLDFVCYALTAILNYEPKEIIMPLLEELTSVNSAPRLQVYGLRLVSTRGAPRKLILACMNHPFPAEVRLAAMDAAYSTPWDIDCRDVPIKFSFLVPIMEQLWPPLELRHLSLVENQAFTKSILNSFISIAQSAPMFFRSQFFKIMRLMLQSALIDEFGERTKVDALRFIFATANTPARMQAWVTVDNFRANLMKVLMKMLASVAPYDPWKMVKIDEGNIEEITSLFVLGRHFLGRLAILLEGKAEIFGHFAKALDRCMGSHSSEFSPKNLRNPYEGWYTWGEDWKKSQAALFVLSHMAMSCTEVHMLTYYEQVNIMIFSSLAHPHERVQWAALDAIENLKFPYYEKPDDRLLMQNLVEFLRGPKSHTIKAKAASSLRLLTTEISKPAARLEPFLPCLINGLLNTIQTGNDVVKQEAMKTLSTIAAASKLLFSQHYKNVMGALKQVLVNSSNSSTRRECMRCIILVKEAIEMAQFEADCEQVINGDSFTNKELLMEVWDRHRAFVEEHYTMVAKSDDDCSRIGAT